MKRIITLLAVALMLCATGTTPAIAAYQNNCPRAAPPVSVNITTATTTTIVAGQPGRHIYVWQFVLENNHASTDVTVTFKDGTTALNGAGQLLKAAGGAWVQTCGGTAVFAISAGSDLNLTTSAAGIISGQLQYTFD